MSRSATTSKKRAGKKAASAEIRIPVPVLAGFTELVIPALALLAVPSAGSGGNAGNFTRNAEGSVADESWPKTHTPQEVGELVEKYGIQAPAIYGPAPGRAYNVTGTPTTYVLNGQGEVAGAHSGETPREVYEGWIEKALGSG